MPVNQLIVNDQIVDALRSAIARGSAGLSMVPEALKRVLQDDMWQERFEQRTRQEVRFATFAEFVTTPPLEGLGTTLSLIRNIVRDDVEALDLLDRVMQREPHRPERTGNNVPSFERPEGNTAAKALRRLRKDRSDLHARVLAGELSPHAAMVEAGFRRATMTIPVEPQAAAIAILRRYTDEQLAHFLAAMNEHQEHHG